MKINLILLIIFNMWAFNIRCCYDSDQERVSLSQQQRITENQVFEFSSGDPYHFEGLGEWKVKIDSKNLLNVRHNVRGEIKNYGPFSLTETEASTIWNLIYAADLRNLEASKRPGLPDEITYTFVMRDENKTDSLKVWMNDIGENDQIENLIKYISTIIHKYVNENIILK